MPGRITRRSMLQSFAGFASSAAFLPMGLGDAALWRMIASDAPRTAAGDDPTEVGDLVDLVPFLNRQRDRRPRERLYGEGLEGRFRQDLTRLSRETLLTPTERFFVRTRAPQSLAKHDPWTIRIDGRVKSPITLRMENLRPDIVERGVHLLECSGNGLGGLISAATWRGVPFAEVFRRTSPEPGVRHVLVSGLDDHANVPRDHWQRGASWIFTFEQLEEAGAFLATHMNDEPLTPDHGKPVRLLVPGWYGCTCIKWVNAIRFVDKNEPSTAQMREFASRTNQSGVPERAADYRPATIDLAAMPVRIERRRLPGGEIVHRVIGIVWGGDQLIDRLLIRFERQPPADADDEEAPTSTPMPVDHFSHTTNRTWSLWSHIWRPKAPGRYVIHLSFDDASIVSRKMERGVYTRRADIKSP